jgi:CheY-like chemotaxis protein
MRRAFSEPGPPATCPACGSEFTLSRERRRGNEALRRIQCIGCGKTAVVSNTRMASVMVISGKDETRHALRMILASAQHEIFEAADAAVGLAAYQQNPVDVVFVDVVSSGRMEAAEFIRQLRRDFPDARVVAISTRTSYGVADPLAIAKQLGAMKALRVPCSQEEIHRALAEARS